MAEPRLNKSARLRCEGDVNNAGFEAPLADWYQGRRRLRFAETVESVHGYETGEFPARGRASSADISLSVEVPDDLRETKGAVPCAKMRSTGGLKTLASALIRRIRGFTTRG